MKAPDGGDRHDRADVEQSEMSAGAGQQQDGLAFEDAAEQHGEEAVLGNQGMQFGWHCDSGGRRL